MVCYDPLGEINLSAEEMEPLLKMAESVAGCHLDKDGTLKWITPEQGRIDALAAASRTVPGTALGDFCAWVMKDPLQRSLDPSNSLMPKAIAAQIMEFLRSEWEAGMPYPEDCAGTAEDALRYDPESYEVRYQRARLLLECGQYAQAGVMARSATLCKMETEEQQRDAQALECAALQKAAWLEVAAMKAAKLCWDFPGFADEAFVNNWLKGRPEKGIEAIREAITAARKVKIWKDPAEKEK